MMNKYEYIMSAKDFMFLPLWYYVHEKFLQFPLVRSGNNSLKYSHTKAKRNIFGRCSNSLVFKRVF